MAEAGEIHVGDTGIKLWIMLTIDDVYQDPADATKIRIFIQRKSKASILEITPEIKTDPLDSKDKCYYETVVGDLNIAGTYTIQAYFELVDGTAHTNTYDFVVVPNIRDIPIT